MWDQRKPCTPPTHCRCKWKPCHVHNSH